VQDPVCKTYIAQRDSIQLRHNGKTSFAFAVNSAAIVSLDPKPVIHLKNHTIIHFA
jgi:hypothetical protein